MCRLPAIDDPYAGMHPIIAGINFPQGFIYTFYAIIGGFLVIACGIGQVIALGLWATFRKGNTKMRWSDFLVPLLISPAPVYLLIVSGKTLEGNIFQLLIVAGALVTGVYLSLARSASPDLGC